MNLNMDTTMAGDLAADITRHFDGTADTADIKCLPKFGALLFFLDSVWECGPDEASRFAF